jgi:hypothetical protein
LTSLAGLTRKQLLSVETIDGEPTLFCIISYLSQLDARLVVGVQTEAGVEWLIELGEKSQCSPEDIEL